MRWLLATAFFAKHSRGIPPANEPQATSHKSLITRHSSLITHHSSLNTFFFIDLQPSST